MWLAVCVCEREGGRGGGRREMGSIGERRRGGWGREGKGGGGEKRRNRIILRYQWISMINFF